MLLYLKVGLVFVFWENEIVTAVECHVEVVRTAIHAAPTGGIICR